MELPPHSLLSFSEKVWCRHLEGPQLILQEMMGDEKWGAASSSHGIACNASEASFSHELFMRVVLSILAFFLARILP